METDTMIAIQELQRRVRALEMHPALNQMPSPAVGGTTGGILLTPQVIEGPAVIINPQTYSPKPAGIYDPDR